jgi:putative copper resistance protein D
VIQLLALWRHSRATALQAFWPLAITRFAAIGMAAVALLVATGIVLAWRYVGSWPGMLGTGYGSLVLAKTWLLAVALALAALNFSAGRRWLLDRDSRAITRRVPFQVEAEAFLLVGLLFLAASVSSQPPATDIPDLTAGIPEVVQMFAPKRPALSTPAHNTYLTDEAARSALAGKPPSVAGTQWSDYNPTSPVSSSRRWAWWLCYLTHADFPGRASGPRASWRSAFFCSSAAMPKPGRWARSGSGTAR